MTVAERPGVLIGRLTWLSDAELETQAEVPELREPVVWEVERRRARDAGAEGWRRWFAALLREGSRQERAVRCRDWPAFRAATRRLHGLLRRGPVGVCGLPAVALWLAAALFDAYPLDAEAAGERAPCRTAERAPPPGSGPFARRPLASGPTSNAPPVEGRRRTRMRAHCG